MFYRGTKSELLKKYDKAWDVIKTLPIIGSIMNKLCYYCTDKLIVFRVYNNFSTVSLLFTLKYFWLILKAAITKALAKVTCVVFETKPKLFNYRQCKCHYIINNKKE